MVRTFKPGWLPMLIGLLLYLVALFGVHTFIGSVLGREIADLSIVVLFFGGLVFLAGRA